MLFTSFGIIHGMIYSEDRTMLSVDFGYGDDYLVLTTKNKELIDKMESFDLDGMFIAYGDPYALKIDGEWIRHIKLINIDRVVEERP